MEIRKNFPQNKQLERLAVAQKVIGAYDQQSDFDPEALGNANFYLEQMEEHLKRDQGFTTREVNTALELYQQASRLQKDPSAEDPIIDYLNQQLSFAQNREIALNNQPPLLELTRIKRELSNLIRGGVGLLSSIRPNLSSLSTFCRLETESYDFVLANHHIRMEEIESGICEVDTLLAQSINISNNLRRHSDLHQQHIQEMCRALLARRFLILGEARLELFPKTYH